MPDSRQHYNKAPIVEAVIEVRYEAPASIASIRQAATRLEGKYGYSNRRDTIEFKTHFNLNSNRTQQEKRVVGLQLASKDQREILILNEHRFTYALLAPYSEWDDLFQKAKNAWNVCSSAWSSRITRIGVRFVNRIDVPISLLETESPKSLFNIYPFFPENISVNLSTYVVNVTIDIEDGWSSRITSSIADPIVPNTQAFLLDIDVFKEEDLPLSGGKLWETIDKVRAKKNRIFEACITQKTRELFE